MNYTSLQYKVKRESLSLIYFLILMLILGFIVCFTAAIMFWMRIDDIDKIQELLLRCNSNNTSID